ncbi:unnamed protein product [Paramecium octaurelia]|uniref:Uncharacterized protein n=1 Tax=Paramecium octaurelia TaxID=43137 RepID=A0A8S1YR71_PAROT|nr:unnamed protein product [Paramecium octaurelia]
MKNKIKLFLVEGINQYQYLNIQNRIQSGWFAIMFIIDNLFTFQSYKGNQMYVYEMNCVTKQFTNTKYITVNKSDDDYTYSLNVILNQNSSLWASVIILSIQQERQIMMSFKLKCLFGQMIDDGKYLITQDQASKEIQIRKCIQE